MTRSSSPRQAPVRIELDLTADQQQVRRAEPAPAPRLSLEARLYRFLGISCLMEEPPQTGQRRTGR